MKVVGLNVSATKTRPTSVPLICASEAKKPSQCMTSVRISMACQRRLVLIQPKGAIRSRLVVIFRSLITDSRKHVDAFGEKAASLLLLSLGFDPGRIRDVRRFDARNSSQKEARTIMVNVPLIACSPDR